MKKLIYIFATLIFLVSCNSKPKEVVLVNTITEAQDTLKTSSQHDTLPYGQAIKNIRIIFEDYKTNEDAIDSDNNKTMMTRSINSLKSVTNTNDLKLLINVWNYYDPTDYTCRKDIYNVLLQNKAISIKAVKNRIKNRMSWESKDMSGTEFKDLLSSLENAK